MSGTRAGAAIAAGLAALVYARAAGAEGMPRIDRDKPFQCLTDGKGRQFRVQCAPPDAPPDKKICVYTPDSERDTDGAWTGPLERALPCYPNGPFDTTLLERQGYKLVEGIADAPYGWHRDERNRIMQVNFDLHRRLYVGGSWSPILQVHDENAEDQSEMGRAAIDFGLFEYQYFSGGKDKARLRHRLSLVEGQVTLAPFGAHVTALRYDLSVRYRTPLVRVTTFLGEPRRWDARLNLGFWFSAVDLEIYSTPAGDENLWRWATAMATADLWQSSDLYSFVRVRAGFGVEKTYRPSLNGPDRDAITPAAAIDADLTLDESGRHHLTGLVLYEAPYFVDVEGTITSGDTADRGRRVKGEVAYEWVFMALNDQPVSLRVAGGASYRDDIYGAVEQVSTYGTIGLRYSLWAPPRRKP
jgi:hypothetical protein